MTEWTWWDGAFALKLIWHTAVIVVGLSIPIGALVFRWAWRRGVKIEAMRRAVEERAAEKLAEKGQERVS